MLQSRMAEILRPAPRPASLAECVCGLRWVGYQPRSLLYACAHVDTKAGAVRPGCLVALKAGVVVALKVAHPGG